MADQTKHSEKEAESNPTEKEEASKKDKKDGKDGKDNEEEIDYKNLYDKLRAEHDVLSKDYNKLREFKREAEKAHRKQLEDKVLAYFPDLEIDSKSSNEYLEGLINAAIKLKKDNDENNENTRRMPNKTEPANKLLDEDEQKKLIRKILDG